MAAAASPPVAQPIRVAVAPAAPGEDPTIVQALNRLPFELADVGFVAPDPDRGAPTDFIVGIARTGAQVVVSVSAARPGAPNASLRSVALSEPIAGGTDQAATLAIRAVEILRATILQAGATGAPVRRPTSPRAPEPAAARPLSEWALGAGASVLRSFRGFGTGWGLTAHAALRPRSWVSQINGKLAHPPRAAASNLQGCVSDETGTLLTKVSDEVAFLDSLKTDPNRIFVATISGPTTPYSIDMVQEANAPEPHPQVHPSCALATGEYAEPSVRIQQWVSSFGSRGMIFPICADSLTPAFQSIGQAIADRAGALCVNGPFPARSDSTQPNCRVADLFPGAAVGEAGQIIPNCVDNGGSASCWTAVDDPSRCGAGAKSLVVTRTFPAPASSFLGITCDPCPNTVPVKLGCGPQ